MIKKLNFYSLRTKLSVSLLISIILSSALYIFIIIPKYKRSFENSFETAQKKHLQTISEAILPFLLTNQIAAVHETLDSIVKRHKDWKRLTLTDSIGRALYPLNEKNEVPFESQGTKTIKNKIYHSKRSYGEISISIIPIVQTNQFKDLNKISMLAFLGFLLLIFLVNIISVDRFLARRIIKLSKNAGETAQGFYNWRLSDNNKDEIGILTRHYENLKTKFIESEKKLVERAELSQKSLEARSIFIANMSHEIRTPLNGIIGMTEILLDNEIDQEKKSKLLVVQNCGKILLSLISDILDFSKIDENKLELENIPSDINVIVENVFSIFNEPSRKKGINLLKTFPEEKIPLVFSDPTRLGQILINILGNAVKFTEKGEVEIGYSFEKKESQGVEINFFVRDTGIGISEKKIKKLFQPFEQEDSTTTRKFGGTGLGLSITKKLTDLFGASIKVTSRQGVGTRFDIRYFTKFCSDTTKWEGGEVLLTCKVPKNCKVLIVEDNKTNQKILSMFLKKIGIPHDLAWDGVEAVSKTALCQYDIIFMDVHMPNMDGIEATERILSQERGFKGVIIATTANVATEDVNRCKAAGMVDFISKPILRKNLLEILNKYLGNKEFD